MRFAYQTLFALALLPFLVLAQSNSQSESQSGSAQVSTSVSTSVGLGNGRSSTTQLITSLITISPSQASTTASSSGNSTGGSGNSTASSTTSSNAPTAPSSIDGGGNIPGVGAPSPGASGQGGVYGPPDSYISEAWHLRGAGAVAVVGAMVGGAMVLV